MSSGMWIALAVVAVVGLGLVISACARATPSDTMGADFRRGPDGRVILLDTPRMRADAAAAYDGNIAMEKRGHVISTGASWNDEWLSTIRLIRRDTENPEWYVNYIIEHRRQAGLPELHGVEDARP